MAAKDAAPKAARAPDPKGALRDAEKARKAIKEAIALIEAALDKAHGGDCTDYCEGADAAGMLEEALTDFPPWMGKLRYGDRD